MSYGTCDQIKNENTTTNRQCFTVKQISKRLWRRPRTIRISVTIPECLSFSISNLVSNTLPGRNWHFDFYFLSAFGFISRIHWNVFPITYKFLCKTKTLVNAYS